MELLHTVVKKRVVNCAKGLIKAFEPMQKEAREEACKKGYCSNKQYFKPNCDWKNLNEDGTEVLLQFKLEIYSNN